MCKCFYCESSYSGRTRLLCMTFGLIIMTSKHFWLLQSTWHQTRVTYLWCIANCSHWNHHIWSQELWEHKFLVLKKVLLFYRSMLRLSSQKSCDHLQWFQWLQLLKHHRYVTLVWCHVFWSKQKCLQVMIISTAMSCTKAVCAHCIVQKCNNIFHINDINVLASKAHLQTLWYCSFSRFERNIRKLNGWHWWPWAWFLQCMPICSTYQHWLFC